MFEKIFLFSCRQNLDISFIKWFYYKTKYFRTLFKVSYNEINETFNRCLKNNCDISILIFLLNKFIIDIDEIIIDNILINNRLDILEIIFIENKILNDVINTIFTKSCYYLSYDIINLLIKYKFIIDENLVKKCIIDILKSGRNDIFTLIYKNIKFYNKLNKKSSYQEIIKYICIKSDINILKMVIVDFDDIDFYYDINNSDHFDIENNKHSIMDILCHNYKNNKEIINYLYSLDLININRFIEYTKGIYPNIYKEIKNDYVLIL